MLKILGNLELVDLSTACQNTDILRNIIMFLHPSVLTKHQFSFEAFQLLNVILDIACELDEDLVKIAFERLSSNSFISTFVRYLNYQRFTNTVVCILISILRMSHLIQ